LAACQAAPVGVCFILVKHLRPIILSHLATLRRSGGSVILSIPKAIVESLALDAGSVVELSLNGRSMSVTPARRTLADRLAVSPSSPATWPRDDRWLEDAPQGRESL
jgi:antitoxin ChpS